MKDDAEFVSCNMEFAQSDLEQRLLYLHYDRVCRYRKTVARRLSRAMKTQPEFKKSWQAQIIEWNEQFDTEIDMLFATGDRDGRLALRQMLVDDRLRLNDEYIDLRRYVRKARIESATAVLDHQVMQHDRFLARIALLLDTADFYMDDVYDKIERGDTQDAEEFGDAAAEFMLNSGFDLRYV